MQTYELSRRQTVAALASTAALAFLPGCKVQSGKPGAATKPPTAESSFGLLTSESAPQAADARAELQSVKASIKAFGRGADGSRVFHLDNGQSWMQLSGGETLLKVSDPVIINRAALGSFQMLVPSGRAVKVKRVG